jgi:hypothetical protein
MNSVVATIADLQKKLSTNSFHGHDKMQLYYDSISKKAPWHAKVTRVTRVTRVNMFKVVFDELKNSSSSSCCCFFVFSMLSPILVAPNLQGEFAQTSTRPGKADQSESLHGSLVFGNVGHQSVFVLNAFDKVTFVFVVNGCEWKIPKHANQSWEGILYLGIEPFALCNSRCLIQVNSKHVRRDLHKSFRNCNLP